MRRPKYMDRVEHWDDERSIGNSLIVTLKWGWSFYQWHEGVMGFDTVAEAKEAVKFALPCKCGECGERRVA